MQDDQNQKTNDGLRSAGLLFAQAIGVGLLLVAIGKCASSKSATDAEPEEPRYLALAGCSAVLTKFLGENADIPGVKISEDHEGFYMSWGMSTRYIEMASGDRASARCEASRDGRLRYMTINGITIYDKRADELPEAGSYSGTPHPSTNSNQPPAPAASSSPPAKPSTPAESAFWKCPGNIFTEKPTSPDCIHYATKERYGDIAKRESQP